ncbi:ATP-dependent DNA ligase [Maioricimonas sp. JC845]|uniref:ATP-dependent DNA ligase n=1 Tax=Maioricimonas sp. JC845 TaxID=3232138 RepID=UPI003458ADD6
MKAFSGLYRQLDETTRTTEKVAAMRDYFRSVPAADAAWAVYFLSGRRPRRLLKARDMAGWCAEIAELPDWMFEECYEFVGDLAETMALLLPDADMESAEPLHVWVEQELLPLRGREPEEQRERVQQAWRRMDRHERFVWNKLITGGFRVGVSQRLVTRALAEAFDVPAAVIAHRLMGDWEPTPTFFTGLISQTTDDVDLSRPYPFCLAHPHEGEIGGLGDIGDWLIEWKWDGIRAQLIRRQGETFLWSRGEEMVLPRFPELEPAAAMLPSGTVLDGEIVGWNEGGVLPFGQLQRRIGRKTVGKKLLREVPAAFIAFDLLEDAGRDVRDRPLSWRRERLQEVLEDLADRHARSSVIDTPVPLFASPLVEATTWDECATVREESRERNVEGLMLKRRDSEYATGRVTGVWWKWKVAPFTVDAVLIYAQRGHGRRAGLYSDYTFAVWDGDTLVPFAKAYSGLTDEEMRRVDQFVRQNTQERFGPVRSVRAELVFELAFEGIQRSPRHKSGIAVRFPRMARWRTDKKPEDADSLETIRALLPAEDGA